MAKRLTKTVKNSMGNRVTLHKGETLRGDGILIYRYTDKSGKRHTISASNIELLREKEAKILENALFGVKNLSQNYTLTNLFNEWVELKRGIKERTLKGYERAYKLHVDPLIGSMPLQEIKYKDVVRVYNTLYDNDEYAISSMNTIQNVLGQLFSYAVRQEYIKCNPATGTMTELKRLQSKEQAHRALTAAEKDRFFSFIKEHKRFQRWYPFFLFLSGTGLRVGEATGLQWSDIDFDTNLITISKTLIHSEGKMDTPKTSAGNRVIAILDYVKEALLLEKKIQRRYGLRCKSNVDGYSDFVFLSARGTYKNPKTIGYALDEIVKEANEEALRDNSIVVLPHITCHTFRKTFCTMMIESGVNIRVVMELMGHSDIKMTLDTYTTVQDDWIRNELNQISSKIRFT